MPQGFLDFILPPFVPPFPTRMTSKTRSTMVCMGGVEEGTKPTMKVDSIIAKVATKSIQVVPNTIEAATKTMHPSTLSIIRETKKGSKKGSKNLQLGDGIKVAPMVE